MPRPHPATRSVVHRFPRPCLARIRFSRRHLSARPVCVSNSPVKPMNEDVGVIDGGPGMAWPLHEAAP